MVQGASLLERVKQPAEFGWVGGTKVTIKDGRMWVTTKDGVKREVPSGSSITVEFAGKAGPVQDSLAVMRSDAEGFLLLKVTETCGGVGTQGPGMRGERQN